MRKKIKRGGVLEETEATEWGADVPPEFQNAEYKNPDYVSPNKHKPIIKSEVKTLSSDPGAQPRQIPTSQSISWPEPRGSNPNVSSARFLGTFNEDIFLVPLDEQERLNEYLHHTFYKPSDSYYSNDTPFPLFPLNHFKLLQMRPSGIAKSKNIFDYTIPNRLPPLLYKKGIHNDELIQDYYKNNNAVLQKIDIFYPDGQITEQYPTEMQLYKKEIYDRFFLAFKKLSKRSGYSLLIIFFIKDNKYYIALGVQEYGSIGDDVKNVLNGLNEVEFDYPLFYYHIIDRKHAYSRGAAMGYNGGYFEILRKKGFPKKDSEFEKMAYQEYQEYQEQKEAATDGGKKTSKKEVATEGGKKTSKKEVLGKMRCIYKIPGDRKEYVKYKGKLITLKDYKMLNTKPKTVTNKKPKRPKKKST